MNITRKNIDELNVVLKITIEKNDYEKPVADQLKEYRQKASIPGFRPGKVPDSRSGSGGYHSEHHWLLLSLLPIFRFCEG